MVKGPRYYRNKYDGTCEICEQVVPAGHGRVRRDRYFNWYTSHHPRTWHGSPISGGWINGCPPLSAEPDNTDTTSNDPATGGPP